MIKNIEKKLEKIVSKKPSKFWKESNKRFKTLYVQRQSIIVLIQDTNEPITRGNLKKLCDEFNFPYHTLCRLKFPILYKDNIIYKCEFK